MRLDLKREAAALLEHEHARLMQIRGGRCAEQGASGLRPEAEGKRTWVEAAGAREPRPPGAMPASGAPSDAEHTGKKIKSSAATPVAVLAIDIETHGWLEHEPAERKRRRAAEGDESQQNKGALHVGSYGRTTGVQPWECEFARVVQLGWCAFGAEGRVLEAQEFSVSDAPAVMYKASSVHKVTKKLVRLALGEPRGLIDPPHVHAD